jgi:hypothetical protein
VYSWRTKKGEPVLARLEDGKMPTVKEVALAARGVQGMLEEDFPASEPLRPAHRIERWLNKPN